jgi:hypothetical protein
MRISIDLMPNPEADRHQHLNSDPDPVSARHQNDDDPQHYLFIYVPMVILPKKVIDSGFKDNESKGSLF